MTEQDQDIFFAVLRAAIWVDGDGQPTAARMKEVVSLIPTGYDWSPLIQLFLDHSLLGVVAHALCSLPEEVCITPSQKSEVMNHVSQLVRFHYNIQQDIQTLFTILEKENLHPALMKGESFAALYPRSCVRSCGDIDMYVVPSEFKRTKQLINEYCGPQAVMASKDGRQHYTLNGPVTEIELHHLPAYPTYSKYVEEVDIWAQSVLTVDSFEKMGPYTVYPLAFNIYFTFDHMCHHINNEGICLRQMIDWFYLLRLATERNLYQSDQEVRLLHDKLACYQTLNAWQILGCVMVNQLGLPRDSFPLYDATKEHIAVCLIDDIINHGSFLKVHQSIAFQRKSDNKQKHEKMSYGVKRFIHTVYNFCKQKQYVATDYDELCNILLPGLKVDNKYSIFGLFRMQYRGLIYRLEKWEELKRLKSINK